MCPWAAAPWEGGLAGTRARGEVPAAGADGDGAWGRTVAPGARQPGAVIFQRAACTRG